MDEPEEIRITPEPPPQPSPFGGGERRSAPAREALPAPLPSEERRQANPADRRFILLVGFFTIASIALMMLIALILLIVVK